MLKGNIFENFFHTMLLSKIQQENGKDSIYNLFTDFTEEMNGRANVSEKHQFYLLCLCGWGGGASSLAKHFLIRPAPNEPLAFHRAIKSRNSFPRFRLDLLKLLNQSKNTKHI